MWFCVRPHLEAWHSIFPKMSKFHRKSPFYTEFELLGREEKQFCAIWRYSWPMTHLKAGTRGGSKYISRISPSPPPGRALLPLPVSGQCPPHTSTHHYHFSADLDAIKFIMRGHTLKLLSHNLQPYENQMKTKGVGTGPAANFISSEDYFLNKNKLLVTCNAWFWSILSSQWCWTLHWLQSDPSSFSAIWSVGL